MNLAARLQCMSLAARLRLATRERRSALAVNLAANPDPIVPRSEPTASGEVHKARSRTTT
jgi:hypothetical protein